MKNHRRTFLMWLLTLVIAQLPLWSEDRLNEMFPWFTKPRHVPVFPDLVYSPGQFAHALAEGRIIPVDLRSAEAFREGHVPGAIHFEISGELDLALARSAIEAKGLCGARAVVFYDESSGLWPIGSAFLQFEAAGNTNTHFLLGGYGAWIASGGSVEVKSSSHPACAFGASAQSEIIVDRQWVADHFGQTGVEILDLRGPGGWESGSYDAPSLFSQGHIPHSLPLDLTALLDKDGGWPSPATARAVLGRLGPRPGTFLNLDSTVVLYGTTTNDPSLGLGYLLLRAMDVQVKIFAGGFQNWAEGGDRPIVRIISTAELRSSLKAGDRKEAGAPIIFDLREEWDFREGHLPGAESLPSHEFAEQIEKRIARERQPVDRLQTPLIFYCYGRECIRSRECSTLAARHGVLRLFWYREDIDYWKQEGGIIEGIEESDKSKATAQIYNSLESLRSSSSHKKKD